MEWATNRSINLPLAGSADKIDTTLPNIARRLHCTATEQGWQLPMLHGHGHDTDMDIGIRQFLKNKDTTRRGYGG